MDVVAKSVATSPITLSAADAGIHLEGVHLEGADV